MKTNIVRLKELVYSKLQNHYVELPDGRLVTADEKSRLRLYSASQMLAQMDRLVAAGLLPEPLTEIPWIGHNKDIITLNAEEIDYILAASMLYHHGLKMAEAEAIKLGHIPIESMLNPKIEEPEEEPVTEE